VTSIPYLLDVMAGNMLGKSSKNSPTDHKPLTLVCGGVGGAIPETGGSRRPELPVQDFLIRQLGSSRETVPALDHLEAAKR
jgi:hypothetical protein